MRNGPAKLVLLVSCLLGAYSQSASAQLSSAALAKLSLEELMRVEVTSVAKKEQRLAEAPAAIYVITQEDIQRSGATSIAEALRMVPGLSVAQINSNSWAISARGFNSRFANKLLVLIDGRSVYTPLFSGVFWDVQDTLLEDIERIEVIRGPAGTLWGANAVNGVINIITKHARDTPGGLFTAATGTEEEGAGALRYGGSVGGKLHYRLFAKHFVRDDFSGGGSGRDSHDEWRAARGGFRVDWESGGADSLSLLGDYYRGRVGERLTVGTLTAPFSETRGGDFPIAGGNLLGRWRRRFGGGQELRLQLYYDRTERRSPVHAEDRDTFDLELQHRLARWRGHELVWGLGYRVTSDALRSSPVISFDPRERTDHLFSGFVQDEFGMLEDRLRFTLGSKFEHNGYTGFEFQPNARLLWMPSERHSVWAAVSRAVRTPSRFEHTIDATFAVIPPLAPPCAAPVPCRVALIGDRDYRSERLVAYELGYRTQLTERVSLDVAVFYNVFEGLRTFEPEPAFLAATPVPHLVNPLRTANRMDGEAYGVEFTAYWAATDFWTLSAGYSYLKVLLRLDRSSGDTLSEVTEGDSPRNQFHIRSYLDLPHRLKLDGAIYYVDRVPNQGVPAYTRADLRLGWAPRDNLDLSVVFQNLFDRRHREFGSGFLINPTRIERAVYGKVVWRF